MPLFSQRRPRGFHHEYIYSGRNKKRAGGSYCTSTNDLSVDKSYAKGDNPKQKRLINPANHARRSDNSSARRGMKVSTGLALLLIVILAVAWKLLLS